jgi:hypothetical protein
MTPRRRAANIGAVKYLLSALLAGVFVLAPGAGAGVADGSAAYSDAVGDAGDAPDISTVTLSHSAGVLVIHVAVANRSALRVPDQAGVFLDVDPDASTGAPQPQFYGSDVLLELFGDGRFWQRRWNGTTFPLEPVPSASYRAEWAAGYRFSIALEELGAPKKIGFIPMTLSAPAGAGIEQDQFRAVYNVETATGEDPFVDPQAPNSPTGVGATRTLRTGVRVTWHPADQAAGYEVWRARTRTGRGARIGTTEHESFLDRRAARGIAYFYWVRAVNDVGKSKPSRRVVGIRR